LYKRLTKDIGMSIYSYKWWLMIKDEKIPESLARLFKLLSDPNRIRILFAIGKAEKSVSEIMSQTALSQTLVSFHLRPLRESGIVAAARQGPFVYYRVSEPVLIDLLLSLAGVSPRESEDQGDFLLPPLQFMRHWME
jgi:DNA-binding transcriptional ArsR family regulator